MFLPVSAFQCQWKTTPCEGMLQLVGHIVGLFLHLVTLKDCGKDCWRRSRRIVSFPWMVLLGVQFQMFLTVGASSLEILEFSLADSLQQLFSSSGLLCYLHFFDCFQISLWRERDKSRVGTITPFFPNCFLTLYHMVRGSSKVLQRK